MRTSYRTEVRCDRCGFKVFLTTPEREIGPHDLPEWSRARLPLRIGHDNVPHLLDLCPTCRQDVYAFMVRKP